MPVAKKKTTAKKTTTKKSVKRAPARRAIVREKVVQAPRPRPMVGPLSAIACFWRR